MKNIKNIGSGEKSSRGGIGTLLIARCLFLSNTGTIWASVSTILKVKCFRILLQCILSLPLVFLLNQGTVHAGQATLSWVAPSTNEDGTPLTDLSGYKIYYGTASHSYTQNIDVGNITTYTVPNLAEGLTYYFAATVYNTSKKESKYSNEISRTIPTPLPQKYTLTVSREGTGTGSVNSSPGGIICGADCTETYDSGTSVTLTALPYASSTFGGWGKACAGTGSCTVVMDSAKSISVTFHDNKAPDLILSTLSDGSRTNNETLNISGTVNDDMGSPQLKINGMTVMVNPDGTFSHALMLIVGPNVITTIASDLAGLQATDTRTINFDPTAPYIEITTPADNSKTKQSTLQVSGTVDESSMITVKVNDYYPLPAQIKGNNFTLSVPLTYGINTIEVAATDLAGNNSSLKRTVIYDDRSPALSITAPSQDIKTNQSTLLIKGTSSDITTTTVTVKQDQEIFTHTLVNGKFEQLITFTIEKTYEIYVTATDELGNETIIQRNIIYDTTPPAISLNAVTSPKNQNSEVLTGTVEATAVVTVLCTTASVGEVNYPTQTTWRVELANMVEGNNLITINATDEGGNVSGQIRVTIVVDTVTPDTMITSAPSNLSNSTSASFSFKSTDSNATFQCQMDNGGYQPCTSTKSYTNLSVGSHTFDVTATDAAGNTDPIPASYSWTIMQAQLPDLSGKWKSSTLTSTLTSKGKQISGILHVTNSGNKNAGSFVVTYYLSADGITLSSVLRRNTMRSLGAGKSTQLLFSYNTAISLTNWYVIAVIDSGNAVAEANEHNNKEVARIP